MNDLVSADLAGNESSVLIGFDIGSVALKVVVTDRTGRLLEHAYRRTNGRPIETARTVLGGVVQRWTDRKIALVAGTGSAGRLVCELLGVPFFNEVICQATAVRDLCPAARTVIEMGGQDTKLIFLPEPGVNGQAMADFTMNTNCAAGTGSFLDQQASRLGVGIEEFGRLALESREPPRVAGRCSVFAKSDMIHLQQQATPIHDIIAGLCLGLARNLKSNLGRGREFARPLAFCGGVAANPGVVRAIREVFELAPEELIVPEEHAVTGALGAVLVGLKQLGGGPPEAGSPSEGRLDLAPLDRYLQQARGIGERLAPLDPPSQPACDPSQLIDEAWQAHGDGEPVEAYLGLDVGSISTKVAIIDAENRVLAKTYLMTAGRPLEAIRRALRGVAEQVGTRVRICGAATTGSGRYLTGDFIGADLVVNEITAQATAAAVIDPEVDTIFEIGGQDSKYVSLDHGVVVDFEMNHACAAGTGSFLEEQAERLGIDIKEEFASLALASRHPIRLGERCTVFMESDLLSYQQQGARVEDLVAGLCSSIVSNYLNRVVGNRRIGRRIFFQGGTAFNRAVVAAFERATGCPITVPPHHEVTGAIGAAVLARRYQQKCGRRESNFGGFTLADLQCDVRSFSCEACSNHCAINEVRIPGRDPLYHGSRCDRYNAKKEQASHKEIPDLFAERQRFLLQHANLPEPRPGRPTVGIPMALANYHLLPFWGTLLGELGVNVVLSPVSTPKIIRRGVEAVLSTPCFPVKVAHGHVLELIDRGVDYLWIPSVISLWREHAENKFNQLCPYVTAIPYQIEAAVDAAARGVKVLKLPVGFQEGRRGLRKHLRPLCREFGVRPRDLDRAIEKAWQSQEAFEAACRARGREVLEGLEPSQRAVVVISRSYNGCDPAVSLDLPGKLRKLGVLAIPIDFLDLNRQEPSNDRLLWSMYWKYGQRILRAADLVRHDPRLHAIYLSNFSCGPDSFLIGYFKRLMAPKPSLVLEIDEHSADAGVVTRLEAFLESLRGAPSPELAPRAPLYPASKQNGHPRTIYLPWMGDQCYALAAALRAFGHSAEVMPTGQQEAMELGRRLLGGKQCLPCLITTGDMIQTTRRADFDPERAAFLMPGGSGPCRFGQYNCMHRLILNDLGLDEVPILSPAHDLDFYDDCQQFGRGSLLLAWQGNCASDLLVRACLAVRPYECESGRTNEVYRRWSRRLCEVIETRPTIRRLADELRQAAADFEAIPVDRRVPKPRIGIVGEIYVRFHDVANNNLIGWLERLGAEVTLAGFPEWMYYTNWTRKQLARRQFQFRSWITAWLQDRVMWKAHRQLSASFESLLGPFSEPPIEELLALAEPYLHRSFEGEAVLSIGKMIELAHQGCHGVINVMPFSCMPSTIVSGVMKKTAASLGKMPMLSISFDGQQDPTLETRLEAFLYQAQAYQASHSHARPLGQQDHVFPQSDL